MAKPVGDPPLSCTVRDCGLPLVRHDRAWQCRRGHSFDIARAGYVNLLQPQDRRSLEAGDTRAAVEARASLIAGGFGRAIVDGFADLAAALPVGGSDVVVDLGSGSGDAIRALVERRGVTGIGLDLSTAAAEFAARRFAAATWVVANADRRLPLLDQSVRLVLSLNGRRNPSECARVLTSDGYLLVGVPASEDLVELRAAVLGAGIERTRTPGVIAEHSADFELVTQHAVREYHTLERAELRKLLQGTYRGERLSAAASIEALERLDVTFACEMLLFAPKAAASLAGRRERSRHRSPYL